MLIKKIFTPKISISVLCIISFFLFLSSKIDPLYEIGSTPLLFLSQFSSIEGLTLFAVSFVFMLRTKFIEKWCGGLDKAYFIHHTLGAMGGGLLISHLVLLLTRSISINISPLLYLVPGKLFSYNMGIFSFYVLILLLTFTLVVKLPYHIWKKSHKFMGIALFFGFLHLTNISSDVSRSSILYFWMVFTTLVGILGYVYREIMYPLLTPRYSYKVEKINNLGEILEIFLNPINESISALPGQFVFIKFINSGGLPTEEHPFSISSGSNQQTLRLSIKMSGDYTKKLSNLQVADIALIKGPFGLFHECLSNSQEVVLIGGGIGISPFLGIISSGITKPLHVFYSVRNKQNSFYDAEIQKAKASQPKLSYLLHNTETSGLLTADIIENSLGTLSGKNFLLCGPKQMMESIRRQLVQKKVNKKFIFSEDFNIK